jgi:radical SAM superfamily enzyme YgiQ (UPF0313 family)
MPRDAVPYPLFMGYAASYVKDHSGAEVVFRDSLARRESYSAFYRHVAREKYDFIFIESGTPAWSHDRNIVAKLHELSPLSKIVITGPITAERSEEIMNTLPVTACIKGEYEKNALLVSQGHVGVLEHNFMTEEEMNASPSPMYDPATIRRYYDRNPKGCVFPHLQVWSSRGCPHKCIFCVWPATMTGIDPDGKGKRMVRFYHPEHLEPFIRKMVAAFGFKSVYFDDDTFNLGNRHTLEICAMMKRIGLPWGAMCRADGIGMDVWQEMRDSGCYGVKLGFESGNQDVVDNIVHKKLDLKLSAAVVRHLKAIGMTVHGTFTIGLPGETPEQMSETLRFSKSLPFDSVQVSGAALMDGTPLKSLLKNQPDENFKSYSGDDNLFDGNKRSQQLMSKLSGRGE